MDPATMFTFASLAMNTVGSVVAAEGAEQQGKADQRAAEFNAAINRRDAGIALNQSAADAAAQKRTAYMAMGSIRAAYGASGVQLEGSPDDVLAMSATNASLEYLNILYRGDLKALGYRTNAQLDIVSGNNARNRASRVSEAEYLTGAGKVIDVLSRRYPTVAAKNTGGSGGGVKTAGEYGTTRNADGALMDT